jgi:hypothetical protein
LTIWEKRTKEYPLWYIHYLNKQMKRKKIQTKANQTNEHNIMCVFFFRRVIKPALEWGEKSSLMARRRRCGFHRGGYTL